MKRPFVETTVVTLPEDIIIQILLKLPAKSLLRFKCVSRRWLFLISDPGFTKLHLQMLKASNLIASQRIVKTSPLETIEYESLDNDVSGDDDRAVVNLDLSVGDIRWEPSLVGSCDGLVCLAFVGGFLLYNPTTKECRFLPRPSHFQVFELFTGFGYDYRSDDYKIIYGSCNDGEYCQVVIFSLNSGSWRRRKVQKESHLKVSEQGVYWNGALHWCVVDKSGNQKKTVILSFDLSEEKFHQVLRVPEVDGNIVFTGLGIHGDSLFIYYGTPMNNCFEAWITNDHEEGGSWTKLFSVLVDDICFLSGVRIVAYTRSQKIIFEVDMEQITLLNPEDNTFKDYPIKSGGDSQSAIYLETLVSPYSGCESSII